MENYYSRIMVLVSHPIWRKVAVFALSFLIGFAALDAQAQGRTISGKITASEDGSGLPGVTLIIKGTTNGTVTDIDGNFTIEVPSDDAILVASFVGYESMEQTVGSRSVIDFGLNLDVETLDEVVIVGYGEMRKADITSAQTAISSQAIGETVNTTLDQAIQGRSAGVYVTQNTGAPGGGVSINIRGVSSINGTNQPLYVIDGVQMQESNSSTGDNPLSNLNPDDVESIDILQGPNATAIYGSRGTNGVVLITTKRGEKGEMKISYRYLFSLQDAPDNLDVMNLRQYAQMSNEHKIATTGSSNTLREEFRDPSILGEGTDWQGELFNRAAMHKHQISISGGSDKTTYYLSGERMTQEGVGVNSGFDRTSLRLNMDNKVNKWLSIGTNLAVSQTDQKLGTMGTGINSLWNNLILSAVQLAPDIPVVNLDGSYGAGDPLADPSQQFSPTNPVAIGNLTTNERTVRNFLGGVNLGVKIIDGLTFNTSFNTNIKYTNSTVFYPTYEFSPYQFNESAQLVNESNQSTYWSWNQQLSYVKEFGKHRLNAMVLHEAQESSWKNLRGGRIGFPSNDILDLNVGDAASAFNRGGQAPWAMESYLTRVNYNYDDRYIMTLAYRADGSVNFAPERKWGYFPSLSAAYRISNESFFNVSQISDLRLRFEAGITGNQGNSGAIYGTLNAGPSEWGTSFTPGRHPNPLYQWEKTEAINYGITLGLFEGRVQIDADYYVKNTDNLILESNLPFYLGTDGNSAIAPPFVNIGSLQNKGWSISLQTININQGGFKWTSNFNISGFETNVTSLVTESGQIDRRLQQPKNNTPFVQRTVVGQSPWQFVGNIQQGVFQNLDDVTNNARPVDSNGDVLPVGENSIWVGDGKYADINGDSLINENDLTFIGNPYPKLFGGFTNTFSYKGISLNVLITGSFGNDIYNLTRDEQTNPNNLNNGRNMMAATLDYAKVNSDDIDNPYVINPETSVPRIQSSSGLNNNYGRYTSTYVEDGSYVRIKNISVNYRLPSSLLDRQNIIRGITMGFSVQNVFTITNYTGYDPEVGAYVGPSYEDVSMIGVDYGRYPLTRTYAFNIGIDF